MHDDTHIFNMLTIIGKLIPQENMKALSAPDLFMLIISVFLHDIGMAPDEKYILAWKNQLPEEEYDEELKEEREKFSRFRLTYTHQLADIERLIAEKEFSKAQLLEDYIVTEYIRTTHSIRAREIIATYWAGKIVYQDTDLTEDLATICYSHNESYTYLLQMESFRVCGQRFKSKSSLSIHGIEVPYNLFPNYSNKMSKAVLNILFPFSFRLDIGVNSDLNLNSARDQIIYDEKWLTFEENLYQVICKRLKEQLSLSDWERLNEIIQKNGKNIFSRVANNIE